MPLAIYTAYWLDPLNRVADSRGKNLTYKREFPVLFGLLHFFHVFLFWSMDC